MIPPIDDAVAPRDALQILAVVGDLSMGQPIDHSRRVAALSTALAARLGWDATALAQVRQVALLRWSGCTANAPEIADTVGDDVQGRAAMLALQFDRIALQVPMSEIPARTAISSAIHCEVSGLVADALGLDGVVRAALGCVFEHWDGSGAPAGLQGEAIPAAAMVVRVCSELEILARTRDPDQALQLMRQRAGVIYPVSMVDCVAGHAADWLAAIEPGTVPDPAEPAGAEASPGVSMALVGHVIDLKLPWLTGHSRAVVGMADALAAAMDLSPDRRALLRRAGWLHGLGRVAIANRVWSRPGPLTAAQWEQVRLAPYWTSRAARQVDALQAAAALASQAFERLDGSGYFRGARAAETPLEARILAVAVAWTALRADRPWRAAWPADAALAALAADGGGARFDPRVLEALAHRVGAPSARRDRSPGDAPLLSAREREVLRRISLGDSNKDAAKHLGISPATVRTHLENVFRKLDCKTRAACTLRASMLGLLDD